jgi:hypothetical protein
VDPILRQKKKEEKGFDPLEAKEMGLGLIAPKDAQEMKHKEIGLNVKKHETKFNERAKQEQVEAVKAKMKHPKAQWVPKLNPKYEKFGFIQTKKKPDVNNPSGSKNGSGKKA